MESCSQRCGRDHTGGSVYLRSQSVLLAEERPRAMSARAGNGKCAILSCIGIFRQVGKAVARG